MVKHSKEIVIKVENYYDRNGQHKSLSPAELKEYILNIYKTLMISSLKAIDFHKLIESSKNCNETGCII